MLENYQIQRTTLIKEFLPFFGDNFVLKGNTALSLYYGLNRYSENLNFDSKSNNMNFINR
ncbi:MULTISPECIES: nucleotidyl transferase AbiEii/AbiGii toxin family protein [unclassified Campylobacter]|uniref:nucleotidyl transferase AbiEii/AbiGii toxin family protein n=1 Tax=unclassified Campylobacter TaxID=2593542 RepID=UPI001CC1EE13|nr:MULTISPECIES: nucleotidyl transferase AbiEii/AbiGii toxin family protein [unclassified Campylobacter]